MNTCIKTDETLWKNQGSIEYCPLRSYTRTPGSKYIVDTLIDPSKVALEQDYLTSKIE